MATSLRDIPGANRARKRRRSERGLWAPSRPTTLDMTPGSLKLNRSAPRRLRPSGGIDVFLVVLVLGAIGVAAWLASAFWGATRVHVEATGGESGDHDGQRG